MDERVLFCAGDFPTLEATLWRELDAVRAEKALAPVIVLVPTNLLRRHLGSEMARRGGCINIHFLTLLDISRKLGEPALALAGRWPLSSLGAELLVRKAAQETRPAAFAAIADRPGFHRALLATIADLKEAGHTPSGLRSALQKLNAGEQNPKYGDLATLWEAYERRLAELGLYDEADLMAAATAAAASDRWLARAVCLFIYGFYDFNELQRRLLAACGAGRPVRAFVPYVQGAAAFRFAEPTVRWFMSAGFCLGAPATPSQGALESSCDALAAFRQRLFEPPLGAPTLEGGLRILSAPNEAREVSEVLRAAVDAARQGTPLPRVGVLLRQAATYEPLFAEECRAGGLDAYHHSPPPLSTSRAGRSLLLLLGLLSDNAAGDEEKAFPRADVMEFLTYADLAVEGEANVADWDLLSMEAGVVKGLASWRERLARLRRCLQEEQESGGDHDVDDDGGNHRPLGAKARLEALDALVRFLEEFFPALQGVPSSGTWGQMVEAVLGVYRRFVRPSDEREAVAEAITGLRALDATAEKADLRTFARFARETLESTLPRRPPFGSRGPVIVDLMTARGLTFDLVCIPGLVENGFPAAPASDPLLSDPERRVLSNAGIPLPLKGERDAEERLLFRLAVGAGARGVILSFPRMEGAGGRQRVPSHFLLRAVEAATGQRADYEALGDFAGHRRISASAFAPAQPQAAWRVAEYDLATVLSIVAACRKQGADGALVGQLGYLAEVAPTFLSAWQAEVNRWEKPHFTAYDGLLTEAAALGALAEKLGPQPWQTSASALEQYASCPYKFFLTHILRLEPLSEPETVRRLPPLDRGKMLHSVLCAFLRRARNEKRLPLKETYAEELVEAARGEFSAFEQHGLVGYPALWTLDKETLEMDLRCFVHDEASDTSGFLPAHFEATFGFQPSDPEHELWSREGLLIQLKNAGALRLRGRIDRIDLTPDGTRGRVVDYKVGKVTEGLADNAFAGGRALQLPIYLLAAEALMPEVTMEAALYRFVTKAGKYNTKKFTKDALNGRKDELLEILATIAEGIRCGRFFVEPQDPQGCSRCDFQAVCGISARTASRLKAGDPIAQQFLKMREVP